MLYVGENEQSSNDSIRMLGIYSKSKKILTFVDFDSSFTLSQKSKKQELFKIDRQHEEIEAQQHNVYDQKQRLVEDFGTSKARKKMNSIRTSIIKEEAISSAVGTKKVLKNQAVPEESDEAQKEKKIKQMEEILPEFNLAADSPSSIYNLDSSHFLNSRPT